MRWWQGAKPLFKWLAVLAVAVVYTIANTGHWTPETASKANPTDAHVVSAGSDAIQAAFDQHRSDVVVQGKGTITKLLKDDTKGLQHQKFLVRLDNGLQVLIVHNIDLANRVEPIQVGEPVAFKGEYVWNPKGGLVHWTHHDPQGRHEAGWIQYQGRVYQ